LGGSVKVNPRSENQPFGPTVRVGGKQGGVRVQQSRLTGSRLRFAVQRGFRIFLLVAEVLVGLATNTTVYISRRGEALKVKNDFHHPSFRFLMAPWAPRAPCSSWLKRDSGGGREPQIRNKLPRTPDSQKSFRIAWAFLSGTDSLFPI